VDNKHSDHKVADYRLRMTDIL